MTIVRNISKGHVDNLFDLGVIKKTGGGGGGEGAESPHGKYGYKMMQKII